MITASHLQVYKESMNRRAPTESCRALSVCRGTTSLSLSAGWPGLMVCECARLATLMLHEINFYRSNIRHMLGEQLLAKPVILKNGFALLQAYLHKINI